MGKNTGIQWADHTFNPWVGCQKISAGCANCYAERDMTRKPRWAKCWGPPATSQRIRTSESYWRQPLAWEREARAAGKTARVFCASLADVFEAGDQLDAWRADLWNLIAATPSLIWMLLTKRPENIAANLPPDWNLYQNGYPNVWLGVTAEDQAAANERIPRLLKISTRCRFVSVEPMVGPVNLYKIPIPGYPPDYATMNVLRRASVFSPHIHWVIAGAESGTDHRDTDQLWVDLLLDQCLMAGVPIFIKQLWRDGQLVHMPTVNSRQWAEIPS